MKELVAGMSAKRSKDYVIPIFVVMDFVVERVGLLLAMGVME